MDLLGYMGAEGHEQIVMCSDPAVGLQAIIAIHDTTLGPACGGVRIWPYESEQEAVMDALRLSRAMTYKSAAADLPLGGGKGVIIADAHTQKTEALLRSYGRFVDTLAGRYLTTTDVGSTGRDLEYVGQETAHVVGKPTTSGGSGDTSVMTGLGVYMGMKACAKQIWHSDSLTGKKVAIQGFGKVGFQLTHHLLKEDVNLVVTDIYSNSLDRARDMGVEVVKPDKIYDIACDIFSPCALGGTVNGETIPRMSCLMVAGGANNQLAEDADGYELHRRGILYAPDYIINAGGIINVSAEIGSEYNLDRAREKTERIYETISRVIQISKDEDIPTSQGANRLVKKRLDSVRSIKSMYRP